MPAVSSAPAGTQHSSLPSHSKTAAVAAGTVGAIVGAIIALIVMLLLLRWRKRRTGDAVRATQHDDDVKNPGADGVGNAFQDTNGSGKSRESAKAIPNKVPLSSTFHLSFPLTSVITSTITEVDTKKPGLLRTDLGQYLASAELILRSIDPQGITKSRAAPQNLNLRTLEK